MRYVIVDLEATCWEKGTSPDRMEIIEIGAALLDSSTGPVSSEFAAFVKPVASPELSDFCTQLTSIRQEDVDGADYFWTVFPQFVAWIGDVPFRLCSWGAYDLNQFRKDCERHRMPLPATFENHINLKKEFSRLKGVKPMGMKGALAMMNIPLEGTHHRGIDDARNIAKLAQILLPQIENGTAELL
jgi:3'-5' exoribonuclease 1